MCHRLRCMPLRSQTSGRLWWRPGNPEKQAASITTALKLAVAIDSTPGERCPLDCWAHRRNPVLTRKLIWKISTHVGFGMSLLLFVGSGGPHGTATNSSSAFLAQKLPHLSRLAMCSHLRCSDVWRFLSNGTGTGVEPTPGPSR